MTKASDNAFPSLLITEGTEPSAPAAGKQRVYIDSTSHLLKVTNSSGTDTNVGFGTGTSMPSSPVTGQRIWRTDLGLECYYDGTRWVTVTLYRDPFHYAGSVMPLTTTGTMGRLTPWAATYDLWLDALWCSTYVLTTNDGSKYWTIDAFKKDASDAGTNIATFSTNADTASNWTQRRVAIGAAYVAASYREFDVTGSRVSTAGTLFWAVALSYRLIVT